MVLWNYCACRWVRVTEEGSSDQFFSDAASMQQEEVEGGTPVPELVTVTKLDDPILSELCATIEVDDDNAPLPKNMPSNLQDNNPSIFGEWGPQWYMLLTQQGSNAIKRALSKYHSTADTIHYHPF